MNMHAPKRAYRQSARVAAAEATAARIVEAFSKLVRERWFDEIRLEDVARDAGVTVQTVLRRFGSKEQLFDAMQRQLDQDIRRRRSVAPGDAAGAVASLVEDYETIGDMVMRMLAQEDRYPACKRLTDIGRAGHREWISEAFEPWLAGMAPEERRRATDALVVAGDVYVWKLIRRDMGRPVAEYRALVEKLCAAAVGRARAQLFGQEGRTA